MYILAKFYTFSILQYCVGTLLNAEQKLNSKKCYGNRDGCVPFRLNLSCVENLQGRRIFRFCTWTM